MSELGPLTFGKKEEQIFLGREIAQHRDYSEETSIRIDSEVRKIVTEQYERARKILEENRDTPIRLADELCSSMSVDGSRFAASWRVCHSIRRSSHQR